MRRKLANTRKKSQNHNAWLYFREAIALSSPVDFMSTLNSDKLYDETQTVQPADMPANGNAVDLSAAGRSFHMTEIFPLAVGDDLDVVVKYSSLDISNTQKTFQDNMACDQGPGREVSGTAGGFCRRGCTCRHAFRTGLRLHASDERD